MVLKKQWILAKGILVDNEGRILVVQRCRPNHSTHGKWEFAGGKVEWGENPSDAVKREVKEETGYDVIGNPLLLDILSDTMKFDTHESHNILLCYICSVDASKFDLVNDKNVLDIKWVQPEEILSMDCLSGTKIFLKQYLSTV